MAKNIIIGVLLIVCAVFFVYALVQQTAAIKAQKEALANLVLAQQNEQDAFKVRARLEAELAECCKRKNR